MQRVAVLLISIVCVLAAADRPLPWGRPKPAGSTPQPQQSVAETATGPVALAKSAHGDWVLTRNGKPYEIRGIGGSVELTMAADAGANSIRTWGADAAPRLLPEAGKLGMTVTVGFWLSHNAGDYTNDGYKNRIRDEVRRTVTAYAKDPALLIWALGNETNAGADTDDAWKFIGELAVLCKQLDPGHPVMSVQAHPGTATLDRMAKFAPAVDIIGVNSYGGLTHWPGLLERSAFTGPFIVTEWGPNGHWEVAKTAWGAPIEQTSSEKAATYAERYAFIVSQKPRCLGSYVFLWGQKQERTPTWYSMFVETASTVGLQGEASPLVDTMTLAWSGRKPANHAPVIGSFTVDGKPVRELRVDTAFTARIDATDPDKDPLVWRFEVMREATQLGNGGSHENRPGHVDDAVVSVGAEARVTVTKPGDYRLFAYVLDGKGKVATANLPFQVR
jgi:hypothetical protein